MRGVTCHRHVHFLAPSFCRFQMTQSKIISSTDAVFAIVDAGNLQHDSHCPLEDVLLNVYDVYDNDMFKNVCVCVRCACARPCMFVRMCVRYVRCVCASVYVHACVCVCVCVFVSACGVCVRSRVLCVHV